MVTLIAINSDRAVPVYGRIYEKTIATHLLLCCTLFSWAPTIIMQQMCYCVSRRGLFAVCENVGILSRGASVFIAYREGRGCNLCVIAGVAHLRQEVVGPYNNNYRP